MNLIRFNPLPINWKCSWIKSKVIPELNDWLNQTPDRMIGRVEGTLDALRNVGNTRQWFKQRVCWTQRGKPCSSSIFLAKRVFSNLVVPVYNKRLEYNAKLKIHYLGKNSTSIGVTLTINMHWYTHRNETTHDTVDRVQLEKGLMEVFQSQLKMRGPFTLFDYFIDLTQ